jgi:hypothetical protein
VKSRILAIGALVNIRLYRLAVAHSAFFHAAGRAGDGVRR